MKRPGVLTHAYVVGDEVIGIAGSINGRFLIQDTR